VGLHQEGKNDSGVILDKEGLGECLTERRVTTLWRQGLERCKALNGQLFYRSSLKKNLSDYKDEILKNLETLGRTMKPSTSIQMRQRKE